MCLIKTKIRNEKDIFNIKLHPILKIWLLNNKKFTGNISLDYRERVRYQNKLIPFNINNKIIFKYLGTFQQNHRYLSKKIRKYVLSHIENNVMCIGGESYIYGMECEKYVYYSNCKKLCYENDFNSKTKSIFIEKYNEIKKNQFKIIYETLIINLSKLNKKLLKIINNLKIKKIIIINCHHKDFWNKIVILSKFKLKIRKKFVSEEYFITISVFDYEYNN